MPFKVVRRFGLSVTGYVTGRGHGDIANVAQFPGDEAAVLKTADSHHRIEALVRQIGNAIAEFGIDYEFRVDLGELHQERDENLETKTDRHLYNYYDISSALTEKAGLQTARPRPGHELQAMSDVPAGKGVFEILKGFLL